MKQTLSKGLTAGFFIAAFSTLFGCSNTKNVTQQMRHTSQDTIHISNMRYDSIYIYKEKLMDHRKGDVEQGLSKPDTLYVRETTVEYRYRLLRDTIVKTHVDSIAHEVVVTKVKHIARPLTLYDRLTRITFWVVIAGFCILLIKSKLKQ